MLKTKNIVSFNLNNNRNVSTLIFFNFLFIIISSIVSIETIYIALIIITLSIINYSVLLFYNIRANNKPLIYIFIYLLIVMSINIIFVGNIEIKDFAFQLLFYLSLSGLLLNFKLKILHFSILYYSFSFFLLIYFYYYKSYEGLFISSSTNGISILLLLLLFLLYLAKFESEKEMNLFPIVLSFIISITAIGRFGILSMFLLLVLSIIKILFINKKSVSILVKITILISILFILVIIIHNPYILEQIFPRFFIKFGSIFEEARFSIWMEYINNIDSIKEVFLGFNLDDSYLISSYYNYNVHSSILQMHALFGLCSVILFLYLSCKCLVLFIKNKHIDIAIISLVFIFRGLADMFYGGSYGDIFIIFIILFPYYYVSRNGYQKHVIN